MIVRKDNQLGLNFTQEIRDEFYAIHHKKYFAQHPPEFVKPFIDQWKWLLSDDKNKNLLFSKTALEISDKIKVDKFKPSILKIKSEKKFTFLIDGNSFYRVCLKSDDIFAIYVQKHNNNYLTYDAFKILPEQDIVSYHRSEDYMKDEVFVRFLKMLIFTEYSETKEVLLKPNHKHGTRAEGKYINETSKDFIIVDSSWNKTIIKKDAFGVVGHFRLQPFGKDRQERKLIYISEFFKNGYVRGAKKDKLN